MSKFDVHLYVQVRVKFAAIEAENHEEAVEEALGRYGRYSGRDELFGSSPFWRAEGIECVCDCETGPEEALVDVVGDEEYGQSRDFMIDGDDVIEATPRVRLKIAQEKAEAEEKHALYQETGDERLRTVM